MNVILAARHDLVLTYCVNHRELQEAAIFAGPRSNDHFRVSAARLVALQGGLPNKNCARLTVWRWPVLHCKSGQDTWARWKLPAYTINGTAGYEPLRSTFHRHVNVPRVGRKRTQHLLHFTLQFEFCCARLRNRRGRIQNHFIAFRQPRLDDK